MRKRSKSFPKHSLSQGVQFLIGLSSGVGYGPYERPLLLKGLGHETETGASQAKVTTLLNFGLLSKSKNEYQITTLGKKIIKPLNDVEKSESLKEAFMFSTLYSTLINHFSDDSAIPENLSVVLERMEDLGVSPSVADITARNFIKSGNYAGKLHGNLIVSLKAGSKALENPSPSVDQQEAEEPKALSNVREAQIDSGVENFYDIPFENGLILKVPSKIKLGDLITDSKFSTVLESIKKIDLTVGSIENVVSI